MIYEGRLSDKDLKWISSRLHRAQMVGRLTDPIAETWRARYAEDVALLLDVLTATMNDVCRALDDSPAPHPARRAEE